MSKTTHEKQLIRLVRKRKLLRARDLAEQGLPITTLTRLVQAGKLDRVAGGLYALPGAAMCAHRSLAEVALLMPWLWFRVAAWAPVRPIPGCERRA